MKLIYFVKQQKRFDCLTMKSLLFKCSVTIILVTQLLPCSTFQNTLPSRHCSPIPIRSTSTNQYRKRNNFQIFSIEKPPFIGAALNKDEDLQRTIEIIMKHVDDLAKKQSTSKADTISSETVQDLNKKDVSMKTVKGGIEISPNRNELKQVKIGSVEKVLSQLTTLFPFFVLSAAIIGMKLPHTLLWVNQGQRVPLMLAAVMMAMGCSLTTDDFKRVLSSKSTADSRSVDGSNKNNLSAIPAGVSCQYLVSAHS